MSFILYYTLFEFFLDWTPGKLITGTRVVTDTGGVPSFQQLLVRAVVRLVIRPSGGTIAGRERVSSERDGCPRLTGPMTCVLPGDVRQARGRLSL